MRTVVFLLDGVQYISAVDPFPQHGSFVDPNNLKNEKLSKAAREKLGKTAVAKYSGAIWCPELNKEVPFIELVAPSQMEFRSD